MGASPLTPGAPLYPFLILDPSDMLYIFYGTNTEVSRERARALIERLRGDSRGFFERITADTFEPDALSARANESGLFSGDIVTMLDGVCENKEAEAVLIQKAKDLALSPNAFILIEEKVSKKIADACEKAGASITVSGGEKKEKGWTETPIFSFADAYARGDRKNAWTLLITLRENGARDEEIIGTLFWRMKTILLAKISASADEAGLKPFVYGVARKLSEGYTKEELQKKLDDLIVLRHETWRISGDLGVALECLVLSGKKK